MPLFPSRPWCDEAVARINADPEIARAGEGWDGDFGIVIEAEAGKLSEPFVLHLVPDGGRVARVRFLEDPDDLEELEPAYTVIGPYSVWKGLLLGTLDPVEVVLRRRLRVTGDIQPLIERARYKAIADRVLAGLETTFPD